MRTAVPDSVCDWICGNRNLASKREKTGNRDLDAHLIAWLVRRFR
jgi:hypothetical protein